MPKKGDIVPTPAPWHPSAVSIRGVTGQCADTINGIYHPTGELYNGKVLLQKEDNPEVWLRYVTQGPDMSMNYLYWMVGDTASKDQNSDRGYARMLQTGRPDPAAESKWNVWNGEEWEQQDVVVERAGEPTAPPEAPIDHGVLLETQRQESNGVTLVQNKWSDFVSRIHNNSHSVTWARKVIHVTGCVELGRCVILRFRCTIFEPSTTPNGISKSKSSSRERITSLLEGNL